MASPTSWPLREMQGSRCLSFPVQKQVFMFSFTSCSFAVEDRNHIYDLGHEILGVKDLKCVYDF